MESLRLSQALPERSRAAAGSSNHRPRDHNPRRRPTTTQAMVRPEWESAAAPAGPAGGSQALALEELFLSSSSSLLCPFPARAVPQPAASALLQLLCAASPELPEAADPQSPEQGTERCRGLGSPLANDSPRAARSRRRLGAAADRGRINIHPLLGAGTAGRELPARASSRARQEGSRSPKGIPSWHLEGKEHSRTGPSLSSRVLPSVSASRNWSHCRGRTRLDRSMEPWNHYS